MKYQCDMIIVQKASVNHCRHANYFHSLKTMRHFV